MTTIVTKWVDRGSISFYGTVITGSASTAFGTISNTQNGSRDLNIDSLYSGADVISLTHNSGTSTLTFSLTGTRANSGWATISIGGTSFSRSAATYSTSNGNTYWNWSLSSTPFGSSNGTDKEIIWDDGGTSVTAPTASSVIITGGTSAQENTTATVNLSNTGSGGTLEYACEVGDTTPDNWQSGNTFTIGRGSGTVYARARRSSTTNSNVVNTSQAAFLIGDSSFSRTSPTIAHNAPSATTTIQYATSGETLAIRVDGESTNLVTALVASSSNSQNISFSSSLPSAGNSETYRFFVRRPTSTGGDGSTFHSTGMTFTVTRSSAPVAPAAPTNLTFSTAATASASTSVTVTASGGGTGTLKVSPDGSTWSANGTTFTSRARGTAHTWYARVESTLNSSNYTEAHTPPYLSPAGGTPANDTILSGASSHTGSISGGTAGTVYEFRSGGYTGTILATVNGNGTAACSGGAGTYYVTRYKTTSTGGSGTTGRTNLATYTVSSVSKQTFTIQVRYLPAETGTPPTFLAPIVTVDAGSITGSVTSNANPLQVSVGDDVIWKKNSNQNTVTVEALSNFTNNSNITLSLAGTTRTLANGPNNTDAIGIEVDGGGNGSALTTYRIKRVGGINPPSGLSSSLSGNESQTETVSLSLSTSGSNGTLEYLQRTTNSMSSTGWQTSNQFSQPRNSTRYYYASRNRNSNSFTGPLTVTVNYLGAVTTGYSFDTTSGNIGYGDGAPAISFTAAQANHTVAVFEGSTARSSGVTGTTDHNNIATNQVPPAGGSNTYNLRTLRNSAAGGNPSASYVATDAGTIEIKRFPQTPTLSYTDNSATVENATTTATLTLSNTDGVSTYWFRRVNDGTSFGNYVQDGNNVVAYADQTRSANQAYDYQGRIVGANGLVSESAVINAQQLLQRYLAPKAFNYATPATISYGATSHTLTITGADSDHTYGWGIGAVGKGTAAHSGSSTVTISSNSALPNAGGEYNYEVLAKRGTSSGGSGSFVSIATNLNVKRYPQTPSGLTTFTDAGTAAASGTFTVAVGALDGASSTTITLSSNYTTNAVTNGSAIFAVVRAGDVIYARNTGANSLTAQAAISTPATYLSPDLSVTATNVSITNTATSASTTIGGMTAGQTVAIRLNNGTTNLATRVGNGALSFTGSLPTYGNSTTYELFTSRPTSAGGSAAFVQTNDTFTVTRAAANSAPTAFDFTNQSGVPINGAERESANTVTIAGLSSGTSLNVSISGGTYSKNGEAYTSANTTTVNGDTFKLKHNSSTSYSTSTTTTLTVGTGSGSFVSTTIGAPTYSVTAPTSINEGSSGTINVTTANVANNTTLYYKVEGVPFSTSNINAADFGGTVPSGSFTISSNAGSFTVTPTADLTTDGQETARVTIRTGSTSGTVVATDDFLIIDTSTTPADTTPADFNLQDVGPVAAGTLATTTAVTITGMDANCPCSITGQGSPEFTVGSGGVWTSDPSTINPNNTINVRLTAPTAYSSTYTATLTIGTKTDTITVTSAAAPSGSGGTSTGIAATAMVNGTSYSILTVGTTNFTSFGAANNNIGTVFTMSNAPGTGTGTVVANSAYGIKIFDTNGTTSVLSPSTRYMVRLTDPTSISLAAATGSNTFIAVNMTGLSASNSDLIFEQFAFVDDVPVTRESNGFRVTNNSGQAFSNIVYAVRF